MSNFSVHVMLVAKHVLEIKFTNVLHVLQLEHLIKFQLDIKNVIVT